MTVDNGVKVNKMWNLLQIFIWVKAIWNLQQNIMSFSLFKIIIASLFDNCLSFFILVLFVTLETCSCHFYIWQLHLCLLKLTFFWMETFLITFVANCVVWLWPDIIFNQVFYLVLFIFKKKHLFQFF